MATGVLIVGTVLAIHRKNLKNHRYPVIGLTDNDPY